MEDLIKRQDAIRAVQDHFSLYGFDGYHDMQMVVGTICKLPSAEPDENKYEYHYDHTDCIWYRPEARNRCPVTCAQYRDGWNDAMNYIFVVEHREKVRKAKDDYFGNRTKWTKTYRTRIMGRK